MANQQTSSGMGQQGTAQGGTSAGRGSATQSQPTSGTGVRDATYNLISVVYHALQGAETYKMYEEDVERTQDGELASFFRQCHEEEKRRAQHGKELLARHLQKQAGTGGQQLQSGMGGQQQAGGGASRQSGGSSNQQSQAVPSDQYGNTQSTSAPKG